MIEAHNNNSKPSPSDSDNGNNTLPVLFFASSRLRALWMALLVLACWLNYVLWFDQHRGLSEVSVLRSQLDEQSASNKYLEHRNDSMRKELSALKQGLAALEERARLNLGMIHQDETFFYILDEDARPKIVR